MGDAQKRHTAEETIGKLRKVGIRVARGQSQTQSRRKPIQASRPPGPKQGQLFDLALVEAVVLQSAPNLSFIQPDANVSYWRLQADLP